METTKVKLTQEQQKKLDDIISELFTGRDEGCHSTEAEIEIDGVIYWVELEYDYDVWSLNNGTWDYPCDYDSSLDYRINAFYYFDEETDQRVDVETGREDWYRIY